MWKLNCGCGNAPTPFEFQIYSDPIFISNINFILPNTTDRTNCLMEKIIQDYFDIINKLECGIQPDLENILEEISLIEMKNNWNFSVTKKVYSSNDNDEEEDYLRRSQYLSEFETEEEKNQAIKNLGLDGTKHIILSKLEYENLTEYEKDAIYFVTE